MRLGKGLGYLLISMGALAIDTRGQRGPAETDRDHAAQVENQHARSGESELLREEWRARLTDIGLAILTTTLVGLLLPVLLAVLITPPSQEQDAATAWWRLALLDLPNAPWAEIALAAVALPTTLIIAVAVGPQAPEHLSGRRVPVSEVVRAEVVGSLATLAALGSSTMLWVFSAFVPRTPGGVLQAVLLVVAALYCACLAGLGGPSHRQRLRALAELRRLEAASAWVADLHQPGRAAVLSSYVVLTVTPGLAVAVVVLARLSTLGVVAQWWGLAVFLGAATASVSWMAWLIWLTWTVLLISRKGHDSLDDIRRRSPFRVMPFAILLLWAMSAIVGLAYLSRANPTAIDISIALFISVAPLLGLWLMRRTALSTAPLARAALLERRRLVRQATSSERRVKRVTDPRGLGADDHPLAPRS